MQKIIKNIEIKGFNSIYYFEFDKNFSHVPEKHDFWEMVYVDSGEIIAITDGLGTKLTQGQIIFHKPFEVHAHISDSKVANNMLVVAFTANNRDMDFFDKKIFTLGKTEKTLLKLFAEEVKRALGAIPNEYHNRNPLNFNKASTISLQLMECYITELLLVLLRHGGTQPKSAGSRELGNNSMTELIQEYLKADIYSALCLNDICTAFYMSKSALCKLFDDYAGIGPMEYYRNIKMNEAKKLLRQDEMNITKISDMLGFSSIHNFSRAFKKSFGMSPSDYRKRINS